jgi:hypothetical protein
MALINYKRGPVLSFFELEDEQMKDVMEWCDDYEDKQFVIDGHNRALDFGSFMRLEHNKLWHGSAHVSNTAWHVIKLSNCGTECIVALYTN